jgi:hypothetical protein
MDHSRITVAEVDEKWHYQLKGSQPDMTPTYGGHDFLNTRYRNISHIVIFQLTLPLYSSSSTPSR